MYNISKIGGNKSQDNDRTKVTFPLGLAVDNVELFNATPNDKIAGISFSFKRAEDNVVIEEGQPAVNTISFLTDTILHPNKDYCKGGRKMQDGSIQTPEQEYDARVRQFMGYVRNIAVTSGVSNKDIDAIGDCEDFNDFATKFCKVINESEDRKGVKCYLKTVKDKNGYTKLPMFRGNGVISPMTAEYPEVWEYSAYETDMINASGVTGVTIEPKKKINFDDI